MPVKKRTRNKKPITKQIREHDLSLKDIELDKQFNVINLQKTILELKEHCLFVEKEHNALKQKIAGLLNQDQIEAAGIAGCPPEIYALEWIQICKEKVIELTPAYTGQVLGLPILKGY